MLVSGDWASMMRTFKKKYGKQHPSKLPGQSYFKAFEKKRVSGELKAETLAEETEAGAESPLGYQLGCTTDDPNSLQVPEQQNTEQLRTKYRIISKMWGNQVAVCTKISMTGPRLDELFNEERFQMEQEVADEKMITPRWEHCLFSY